MVIKLAQKLLSRHLFHLAELKGRPVRTSISLFALWICLLGAGCQSVFISEGMPIEVTQSEAAEHLLSTQGVELMTPSLPTPTDPELQNLIELAAQDLAARLGVSFTEIFVIEATSVEWSDSSLDCPQEGMSYLQVITPGYRIVLQAESQTHEYHTNRAGYLVLCNNRLPPITPQP